MTLGQEFFDFNTAESRSFDLIPKKTVCPVIMSIKPGGHGDGGWLRPSKSSDAMMLDCEFTVSAGTYAKRKIFQLITISGGKLDDRGNSVGGSMGRSLLRSIVESARGINAKDFSDAAQQKRRINSFQDLCGIEFLGEIGIEAGKDGYDDKNKVTAALSPGMKAYDNYFSQPAQPSFAATAQTYAPAQQQQTATPAPQWAAPAATAPAPQQSFSTPGPQAPQDMTPPWAK